MSLASNNQETIKIKDIGGQAAELVRESWVKGNAMSADSLSLKDVRRSLKKHSKRQPTRVSVLE